MDDNAIKTEFKIYEGNKETINNFMYSAINAEIIRAGEYIYRDNKVYIIKFYAKHSSGPMTYIPIIVFENGKTKLITKIYHSTFSMETSRYLSTDVARRVLGLELQSDMWIRTAFDIDDELLEEKFAQITATINMMKAHE